MYLAFLLYVQRVDANKFSSCISSITLIPCLYVKFTPQHLHKAKLETLTMYDISITSRIHQSMRPFLRVPPPGLKTLVCA